MLSHIRCILAVCIVLITGVALPSLSTVHVLAEVSPEQLMNRESTELKVLKDVAGEICPDQLDEGEENPNPYALGHNYYILNCEVEPNDHINSVHIQRFASSYEARTHFGQEGDDAPSFPPEERIYPSYETDDVEENQIRHYWLAERWIISARAVDRSIPRKTMEPLDVSLIVYDVAEEYALFTIHTHYLPMVQS